MHNRPTYLGFQYAGHLQPNRDVERLKNFPFPYPLLEDFYQPIPLTSFCTPHLFLSSNSLKGGSKQSK